jgi:hypothetical protein
MQPDSNLRPVEITIFNTNGKILLMGELATSVLSFFWREVTEVFTTHSYANTGFWILGKFDRKLEVRKYF